MTVLEPPQTAPQNHCGQETPTPTTDSNPTTDLSTPRAVDSRAFKFDNGLSNDEVFGSFAKLAKRLRRRFGLRAGVQEIDPEVVDRLRAEQPRKVVLIERPPRQKAAGSTDFEILLPHYDRTIVSDSTGDRETRRAEELQQRLESMFGAPLADLQIELTVLDDSILARLRFSAELDVDDVERAMKAAAIPVEILRPAGRPSEPVEFDASVFAPNGFEPDRLERELVEGVDVGDEPDGRPAVLQLSGGRADLQAGAIGFEPGDIGYEPGDIGYEPGTYSFHRGILPQPMVQPAEEINAYQQLRWRVAMFPARIRRSVTVAILDTGIDPKTRNTHPLFTGNTDADPWGGSPDAELRRTRRADAVFGHGTHVAGIVAQRAPFAVLNHESIRARAGDGSDSFELARDMPDVERADIFVFSFATAASDEAELPALRQTVDYLLARGKVIVAAAGTEFDLVDPEDRLYPADFSVAPESPGRLICVGAVDREGRDMVGTRRSKAKNAVKTYGVGIASAYPSGRYQWSENGPVLAFNGWARWTGTSMAAPRVAGAIASYYQTRAGVGTAAEAADAVLRRARANGGLVT